ncbi:MAG: helix-turn-helix transcriptional regulator [Actinobacteria bacterium]|nr:helix-turn-helix transcriptional regulator [Actinomycetota bacterium]
MARKSEDARRRFAANVDRLRRQHGYSSEQLAERSRIGSEELGAILRCEVDTPVEAVYRLAGALGVPPGDLHEGVAWIPDGEGGGEFRIDEPGGD